MSKFKKGDKVVFKHPEFSNYKAHIYGSITKEIFQIGKEFTVEGYHCDISGYMKFLGEDLGEFESCFELVQEEGKTIEEDEIRKLIDLANATLRAVETYNNNHPHNRIKYCQAGSEYYISTFTPFSIGQNWLVKLVGDRLHIGCRDYEAGCVLQGLVELLEADQSQYEDLGGQIRISATRMGIIEGQDKISWEDAEKILKALKDAGV